MKYLSSDLHSRIGIFMKKPTFWVKLQVRLVNGGICPCHQQDPYLPAEGPKTKTWS